MNFIEEAIQRITSYFPNYDTNSPAEIMADIVHYCRENKIDISAEFDLALSYAEAEAEACGVPSGTLDTE